MAISVTFFDGTTTDLNPAVFQVSEFGQRWILASAAVEGAGWSNAHNGQGYAYLRDDTGRLIYRWPNVGGHWPSVARMRYGRPTMTDGFFLIDHRGDLVGLDN